MALNAGVEILDIGRGADHGAVVGGRTRVSGLGGREPLFEQLDPALDHVLLALGVEMLTDVSGVTGEQHGVTKPPLTLGAGRTQARQLLLDLTAPRRREVLLVHRCDRPRSGRSRHQAETRIHRSISPWASPAGR